MGVEPEDDFGGAELEIEALEPDPPPARAPSRPSAAGTRPPESQRRRASVDEPIESGEIDVGRRSLVIRSQSVPTLPVFEEPTRVDAPLPEGTRWHVVWLVVAMLAGAAGGAAILLDRGATAPGPNLDAATQVIGSALDAERHAALVRAEALASSSMLRAAIDTDAATLADMARDQDVVFPLEPGQALEIVQLRDGARTVLLRLPAGTAPLPVPDARPQLGLRADVLGVLAAAPIGKQPTGAAGQVVLWAPIDRAALAARLPETAGAELEGLDRPVPLVVSEQRPTIHAPIATKLPTDRPLALGVVVPETPPRFTLVRDVALATSAGSLVLAALALGLRRGGRRRDPASRSRRR